MRTGGQIAVIGVLLELAANCAAAQSRVPRASRESVVTAPGRDARSALEVVDEVGRRVAIPAEVRRIVSLAPSLTETIYALELQDRLVGDTDYCDYPPQAQAKPHVGGPMNPNVEQVVTLHPDLVLATRQGNRLETVEALTRLGLPVYATDPKSVDEVIESARRLGAVLGAHQRGEALALQLRARLDDIKRRIAARPARRVFFVVWPDPLISIGRNTFLADALRRAGAESVVETAQDWPRLSIEEVLRLQPEYLVFSSTHFEDASRTVEDLRDRAGWRALDAIRERRIAVVSDAVNHPSPRLVDAIEQLARQLHPQAFTPENEKPKMEKEKPKTESAIAPRNFSHTGASLSGGHFLLSVSDGGTTEVTRCAC